MDGPLGIHEDNTGSFVMHFHLGPGDKTMYMWERSNYEKTLGGTQNNRDVKSYIPFVDYTCNFKQGDIFFMPWNYYHIGKSDDLSIGLTVRFNYTNVDGLLNGVWRSGLKEITDEELSDNIVVPNMQSIEDSAALDQIISQLEEEVNEMSINDFLLEQLDDYSDALRSNGWYDSGDIKRKKESVELEENTKVKINKSKIRYKRSGDSIKFFHRGDKLSFHYHEDMEKLITLLNTGEANTALALLDNLFTDWPEGIGVRLLEILCENDVLLIIE